MLGFDVSERTISRWMRKAPRDPEPAKRWLAFLRNHREAIAAMDFFTVPTITFGVLYCFFVISHDRRRILHVNVTKHPTSGWIIQQLREAFPFEAFHKYLIFDRDQKFGFEVIAAVKATRMIPKQTSFRSPWQNGMAERSFRSFGSDPFTGATRRAAPSLQSSGLARIDVPPVLYICALHAHSGSCPPESSCCTEAIIVFRPTLPSTTPCWVSSEVLASHSLRLNGSNASGQHTGSSPLVGQRIGPIVFPLTTSHIVKYSCVVHIVTRKHLNEAMRQYPDAANEIKAWVAIVKQVRWHNFPEVRSTFKDADNVKGYVIFDVRKNRYRLVTVIHYAKTTNHVRTQGHVYIRSFLTHKEYDNPANWDRKFGTK